MEMPVITRKTLAMEIEILETCSLAAKISHAAFRQGDLIATVEIEVEDLSVNTSWWVSGVNCDGALSILFQAQLPFGIGTQKQLDEELINFAQVHAFPLAARASETSFGLTAYQEERLPENKSRLFLSHLRYRFTDHLRSNLSPAKQTIQQFYLATSLRLGTQLRDIAKFQKISPMTIETRITRARKSGELPKAKVSAAADIKDLN
jgi:DNA-binding CsgD family transcriptional regulator